MQPPLSYLTREYSSNAVVNEAHNIVVITAKCFCFFAGLVFERHALQHEMIQWNGMKD